MKVVHQIAKDFVQAIVDLASAYGLGGVANLIIKAARNYDWDEVENIKRKYLAQVLNQSDLTRLNNVIQNFRAKSPTQTIAALEGYDHLNTASKKAASNVVEAQRIADLAEKAKSGILSTDDRKDFKKFYSAAKPKED